jgi:hypothetical protein
MAQNERKIAAGDLETDPFEHGVLPECFMAGFYDGKRHRVWKGPNAARDFVKFALCFEGIIYFHNGGNFDFHFFLDHLPLADCKFFCIGKRIVQIKCGKMELRDSYAIIPKPLSSWGKTEIDIRKLHRDVRHKHMAEIESYLRDDCTNLLSLVNGFIDRFGLSLTLASTSFKVLRTQFNVPILRTSSRFDRRLRKHYFAGRVQYFSLGRHVGRVECLDINSAFPHAMCSPHFYSTTYKTYFGAWPKKREESLYVVECEAGGALAQRMDDGSVEFPKGFGEYHTTGWELLAGLKHKAVKRLKIKLAFEPKKCRDFGEFVRFFYEGKAAAKEAGDKATEYFYKIMLNAAYGKFGQNPEKFRDVAVQPWREEPEGGGWEIAYDDEARGITFYERPSTKKPREGGEFYNVAVAASITGYVRSVLFDAMASAKKVLYCDTDSLVGQGFKVARGSGLGEWKLEKVFDVFWAGGKKLYVGHDEKFPWYRRRPKWAGEATRKGPRGVFIEGLGWTDRVSFKTASKGVNLPVEDLIAVCEGEARVSRFDAPTYSIFRGTGFTKRRVVRSDKRVSKGVSLA